MYGTPSEVFGRAADLESVGLTVPQVTKMMLLLAEKGFDVRTDIYTVAQAKAEIERLMEQA
jgi:energy-coupling factor transport system ATP-binding protein